MLPGYLHFDVRRGLTADMLNASMLSLLPDHACVNQAFYALGLHEITFVAKKGKSRNLVGHRIHFYIKNRLIEAKDSNELKLSRSLKRPSPMWDNKHESKIIDSANLPDEIDSLLLKNELLEACLNNEAITLEQLRAPFLRKNKKASISSLALKILDELSSGIFTEQKLMGSQALFLLCHLVMLASLVDALDPKFISASKLYVPERTDNKPLKDTLSLHDNIWIHQVLMRVQAIETDELISVDVLAVAFLKALCGHFGARGESSILEVGFGLSGSREHADCGVVLALWCEAYLPNSISECGPSNSARIKSVYEISGNVAATVDMTHLCSVMSLHGATAISWHLVLGEKNTTFYSVKMVCTEDDRQEVIEAFLIKGGAYDVLARAVERHELNRRLVNVPLGSGNKVSQARFYEYIYYDKTVRVEPLKEDLDHYIQKTDYSIDVARSDLLLAWKKWRGRIAEEST